MALTLRSSGSPLLLAVVFVATGCPKPQPLGLQSPPEPTTDRAVGVDLRREALESRVGPMVDHLDAARQRAHVPGLAIAVVSSSGLLAARGLGHANLEDDAAMTPQTVLPIGELTQTITVALAAQMVDAGLGDWNDPVLEDGSLSLRDAFTHQTGMASQRSLWVAGQANAGALAQAQAEAVPFKPSGFVRNDVMVARAANTITTALGSSSWSELTRERLLSPLGMRATLLDSTRPSVGYRWDPASNANVPVETPDWSAVGPAVGARSNALDLSKWVRFQLGQGTLDGQRLVASQTMAMTRIPTVDLGLEPGVAMGWRTGQWRGRMVLFNVASGPGFSAAISIVPEEDLGFVALMNAADPAFVGSLPELVWSSMFGDIDPSGLEGLIGRYVDHTGAAKRWAEVTTAQSQLQIKLSEGGQPMTLGNPGQDGWRRASDGDVLVDFDVFKAGRAQVLDVRTGGEVFELKREGYVPPPEVPLRSLAAVAGDYGAARAEVVDNLLVVTTPAANGVVTFGLRPPNIARQWGLRHAPGWVAFVGQPAAALVVSRPGVPLSAWWRRPASAAPRSSVALADLLGAREATEKRIVKASGAWRLSGEIRYPHQGARGSIEVVFDAKHMIRRVDLGPLGVDTQILGERAWAGREGVMHPVEAAELALHPLEIHRDWSKAFAGVELLGDGLVEVQPSARPAMLLELGESGRVTGVRWVGLRDGQAMAMTTRFADVRVEDGLELPFEVVTADPQRGDEVIRWTTLERVDAVAFKPAL